MIKTISAIAVAAAIAAAVTVFPSLSASVEARGPVAKIETTDVTPQDTACAQQAWPYIEAKCLRNDNRPMGQARDVRIVSLDRTHTDAATSAKVR
jgi:hypothetical protein